MLSEEARRLIFENKRGYEEQLKKASEKAEKETFKEDPATAREEIRKRDYENSRNLARVYSHTSVTTENFDGVPTDVMIPEKIVRKEAFFFIHGGAWAFGSAMNARLTACCYTEECGAVALCPDYRLAPEHKFSALLDDCYRSYKEAVRRYGAENIVLSGSSAGGNLSLALMQKLREEKEIYPKAMILFSPAAEINPEKDSLFMRAYDIVLRDYDDEAVADFGDYAEDYKGKYMSPLYGEYDGFPPMYICCGSEEVLLQDSYRLFMKAKRSGVRAVLSVRAGMWHSYPECQRFIPEGKQEILNAVSFIDDIANGGSVV